MLSSATAMKGDDVPTDFPGRERIFSDDTWFNPGDAVVVKPGGGIVAGPMHKEQGILYADIDVSAARASRKGLDVAGHYGRPDIFKLQVDRSPMPAVSFIDNLTQDSASANGIPRRKHDNVNIE